MLELPPAAAQVGEYQNMISLGHIWVRPTAVKLQLTARREQCWREAVIASRTRQDIITENIITQTLIDKGYQAILV